MSFQRIAGIPSRDGEHAQVGQRRTKHFPKRFDGEYSVEQRGEIVNLGYRKIRHDEPRFQIFFGALLSMKARCVRVRATQTE